MRAREPVLGLFYGEARTPVAVIVPDPAYRGMFRVLFTDGTRSDMVNRARAKDAAAALAERGPPRRDARALRWRMSRESLQGARTRVSRDAPLRRQPSRRAPPQRHATSNRNRCDETGRTRPLCARAGQAQADRCAFAPKSPRPKRHARGTRRASNQDARTASAAAMTTEFTKRGKPALSPEHVILSLAARALLHPQGDNHA
jgi:hypothetical protein